MLSTILYYYPSSLSILSYIANRDFHWDIHAVFTKWRYAETLSHHGSPKCSNFYDIVDDS